MNSFDINTAGVSVGQYTQMTFGIEKYIAVATRITDQQKAV